ncbi:hypothetical protein LU11_gp017 [Pseudomonas phage Lu11]|uniref:hypothetical protein n=1 Tax=Pseudomonas phage Lu11 TaxID=1161927 RepID=UPI00025F14EB|nr:hypothetical protein LU11_gp017 [Pseudomonas phage Lu11]AFH14548.1 hypothetical protein Lu11_0017 [Pseudomonas phage Lu11]
MTVSRNTKVSDVNKRLKKSGLKIERANDGKQWSWFVFNGKERGRKVSSLLINDLSDDLLVDLAKRFAAPVYVPPAHRDVRGLLVEIGDVVAVGYDNGSTLRYGTVTALSEYVWIGSDEKNGRTRRVSKRVAILEKRK